MGAFVLGLLTIIAVPTGPAAAVTVPVTDGPWITCDATTRLITTGLHTGNLPAGRKVNATFTVSTGRTITATAFGSLPQWNQSTTTTGTVGADYKLDLTGYTRAWDPSPYLYYSETVRVVLQFADTGATIGNPSIATCYYDPRNTYTVTCGGDPAAFALTVTGTHATAGSTDVVTYPSAVTYRQSIDEDTGSGFIRHAQTEETHRFTRTGDTWSDAGIAKDLSKHVSFVDRIEVTVTNPFGWVVGGAKLSCAYPA